MRRLDWGFGAFVALCLLLTTPVRADEAQEARALFEAGVAASHSERWQEAREYFTRSIELVPKATSFINLAVAEIRLGLGEEALATLDRFDSLAGAEHASLIERARSLRTLAEELASEQARSNGPDAPPPPNPTDLKEVEVHAGASAPPASTGVEPDNTSRPRTPFGVMAARSLLVAAGALGAASLGGGIGWYVVEKRLDECDAASPPCLNRDDVEADRKPAIRLTFTAGALAAGLFVAGTVWLLRHNRKAEPHASFDGMTFRF